MNSSAAFRPLREITCLPSRRVRAFPSWMFFRKAVMVAASSVLRCQGVSCQCCLSSFRGELSSSSRGAISGSLTEGVSSPPRSIRSVASVFAPALRVSVMTRPRCSPVLRARQKFWLLQVTCQSEKACCAGAARTCGARSTQNRENKKTL